jgi:hypothetical protein
MIPSFLIRQGHRAVNTRPCHRSLCAAQGEKHGDPAEGKVDKVPEGRRGEKGRTAGAAFVRGEGLREKAFPRFGVFWGPFFWEGSPRIL